MAILLGSLAAMTALGATAAAFCFIMAALFLCQFGGLGSAAREDQSTRRESPFYPIGNPVEGIIRERPAGAHTRHHQLLALREMDEAKENNKDSGQEVEGRTLAGFVRLEEGQLERPQSDMAGTDGKDDGSTSRFGSHHQTEPDDDEGLDTSPSLVLVKDDDEAGVDSWSMFGSCDEGHEEEDGADLTAYEKGSVLSCEETARVSGGHSGGHAEAEAGRGDGDGNWPSEAGLRRRPAGNVCHSKQYSMS